MNISEIKINYPQKKKKDNTFPVVDALPGSVFKTLIQAIIILHFTQFGNANKHSSRFPHFQTHLCISLLFNINPSFS